MSIGIALRVPTARRHGALLCGKSASFIGTCQTPLPVTLKVDLDDAGNTSSAYMAGPLMDPLIHEAYVDQRVDCVPRGWPGRVPFRVSRAASDGSIDQGLKIHAFPGEWSH